MSNRLSRRRYVLAGGAVTLGALAGCAGGDGDDGADDVPAAIDEFLTDARLYDGTIADHTGSDEVVVDVGGGGDGLAFDPPAIRIDSGTTVRWEWTGEGGAHNVVSDAESDFEFSSGDQVDDPDATFEHTFDDAGIGLYVCEPHASVGMLGGIDVID
ncbi:halocyanin domain-containing protein [Halorubrum sp. DTA98]|uniref:halocyanin domain-containing protein n=1 Tax=Halorubrum sp. DTA98 TaxID=3402163 RepID=UPI003AAECC76